RYAAEYNLPGLAHGFVITSAIARGRIRRIDARDALAVDGVLDVITHENRPKLASSDDKYHDDVAPPGVPYRPLYDDKVRWSGQPVALVVAEDLETARYAASFVQIEYQRDEHVTDVDEERRNTYVPPQERGGIGGPAEDADDAAEAFAQAEVKIEA